MLLLTRTPPDATNTVLRVDPEPSQTEAATVLGLMDLRTGRPVLEWHALRELETSCRWHTTVMPLLNPNGPGLLAVFIREGTPTSPELVVLLARSPTLDNRAAPLGYDLVDPAPLTFSPYVYRLRPLLDGHTTNATTGDLLPWPHAAMDATTSMPPVCHPNQARPGALVAPWALGGAAPEGFVAAIEAMLLHQNDLTAGSLVISGAQMDDDGTIGPITTGWSHIPGRSSPKITKIFEAWVRSRLAAPGCPWGPTQLVAQRHSFAWMGSTLTPARMRTPADLAVFNIARLRARTYSAHQRLVHTQTYQQIRNW